MANDLWNGLKRVDENIHERVDRIETVVAKLLHLAGPDDVAAMHAVELPSDTPVAALTPDQERIAALEAQIKAMQPNTDITSQVDAAAVVTDPSKGGK